MPTDAASPPPPGRLIAERDVGALAKRTSLEIGAALRSAIAARQSASLALSGGNTPREAYARLALEPGIDWASVHVFWVDERAVAPTDDRSNYRWAKVTLLDAARIGVDNIHRMVAESAQPDVAARAYEQSVRAHVTADAAGVPAFDALVLGVGDDGHTASLFPGEPTVDIRDRLVVPIPAGGPHEARMTLTAPAIEHARNVYVLAVGASKRAPLARVWSPEGTLSETPARVLRACRGSLVWLVDSPAAGLENTR